MRKRSAMCAEPVAFPADVVEFFSHEHDEYINFIESKTVDEQLTAIRIICDTNEYGEHDLLLFLAMIFLHGPNKHPVKAFTLKHIMKNPLLHNEFTDTLTGEIAEILAEEPKDAKCYANIILTVLTPCFENFTPGTEAAKRLHVKLLRFFKESLSCSTTSLMQNNLSPTSRNDLYLLTHASMKLMVQILHHSRYEENSERPEIFESTRLIIKYIFTDEELPKDTKILAGILLMVMHALQYGQHKWIDVLTAERDNNMFKDFLTDDIEKLSLYNALIKQAPQSELVCYSIDVTPAIIVIANGVLAIGERTSLDSSFALLVSRTVLSIAKMSRLMFETSFSELEPKILDFVWSHLEHDMESVRRLALDILSYVIDYYSSLPPDETQAYNEKLAEKLKELDRGTKTFFVATAACVGEIGGSDLLELLPDLVDWILDALPVQSLQSSAFRCMKLVLAQHTVETDAPTINAVWLNKIVDFIAGSQIDFTLLEFVRPVLHHVINLNNEIGFELLSKMIELCDADYEGVECSTELKKALFLLNVIRRSDFFGTLVIEERYGHWKGFISYRLLRTAAVLAMEETRVLSLSIVISSHRVTDVFDKAELNFIVHSLKYNMDPQTPGFKQHLLHYMDQFLNRFSFSFTAASRRKDEGTIAEYVSFIASFTQICFDSLLPGLNHRRQDMAVTLLLKMLRIKINPVLPWKPEYVERLLLLLDDTFEQTVEAAYNVLIYCPEDLIQLKYSVSLETEDILWQASSVKPSESVSAAYKLLVARNRRRSEIIAENRSLPRPNVERVDYILLTLLVNKLKEQLIIAQTNLLMAAREAPMYGVMKCMLEIMHRVNIRPIVTDSLWSALIADIVLVCKQINEAVATVVNNESPEGYLPAPIPAEFAINGTISKDTTWESLADDLLMVCNELDKADETEEPVEETHNGLADVQLAPPAEGAAPAANVATESRSSALDTIDDVIVVSVDVHEPAGPSAHAPAAAAAAPAEAPTAETPAAETPPADAPPAEAPAAEATAAEAPPAEAPPADAPAAEAPAAATPPAEAPPAEAPAAAGAPPAEGPAAAVAPPAEAPAAAVALPAEAPAAAVAPPAADVASRDDILTVQQLAGVEEPTEDDLIAILGRLILEDGPGSQRPIGDGGPALPLPPPAQAQPAAADGAVASGDSQKVLLCAWRSVKESSLLMGEMVSRLSIVGEGRSAGNLTEQQVVDMGKHFIQMLMEAKHKGAVEQACVGFSKLLKRVSRCKNPALNELPRTWLSEYMALLTSGEHASLSATRRSAGFPYLIQALVTCEVEENKNTRSFQNCMTTLLEAAVAPPRSPTDDTRAHCLNILKALYRNTTLGDEAASRVGDGLKVAIDVFDANNWKERNSTTQLFTALMIRVFGVQRNRGMALSPRNCLTGRIFFQRYPYMYDFMLERLKEIRNDIDLTTKPSLYPILLLLSRLYPSAVEGNASNLRLVQFVPYLQMCAESNIMMTRELGARAMVPLFARDEIGPFMLQLVEKFDEPELPSNFFHGILVFLISAMDTPFPKSPELDEKIARHVSGSTWLIEYAQASQQFMLLAEYAEFINQLAHRYPQVLTAATGITIAEALIDIIFEEQWNDTNVGKDFGLSNGNYLVFVLLHKFKVEDLVAHIFASMKCMNEAVAITALKYILLIHKYDVVDNRFLRHLNEITDHQDLLLTVRLHDDYNDFLANIMRNCQDKKMKHMALKLLSVKMHTQSTILAVLYGRAMRNVNEVIQKLLGTVQTGGPHKHIYLESLLNYLAILLNVMSKENLLNIMMEVLQVVDEEECAEVIIKFLKENAQAVFYAQFSPNEQKERFEYQMSLLCTVVTLFEAEQPALRQGAADVVALAPREPVVRDRVGPAKAAELFCKLLEGMSSSEEETVAMYTAVALLDRGEYEIGPNDQGQAFEPKDPQTDETMWVMLATERIRILLESTSESEDSDDESGDNSAERERGSRNWTRNYFRNILNSPIYSEGLEDLCQFSYSLLSRYVDEQLLADDEIDFGNFKIELFIKRLFGSTAA